MASSGCGGCKVAARSTSVSLVAAAFIACLALVSCSEKTPNRDHIPVLRQKLFELQEAVKEKNRAAIDSLLSVSILDNQQNSESLLELCYNDGGNYFFFERFGDYEIFYTNQRARIDCYVMDSTNSLDRPITLTFIHEHDLWLLKKYEVTEKAIDSL